MDNAPCSRALNRALQTPDLFPQRLAPGAGKAGGESAGVPDVGCGLVSTEANKI